MNSIIDYYMLYVTGIGCTGRVPIATVLTFCLRATVEPLLADTSHHSIIP